jgi:hypothetical protein
MRTAVRRLRVCGLLCGQCCAATCAANSDALKRAVHRAALRSAALNRRGLLHKLCCVAATSLLCTIIRARRRAESHLSAL